MAVSPFAVQLLTLAGLRRRFPPERTIGLADLQPDWTYVASSPDMVDRVQRLRARRRTHAAPPTAELRPIAQPRTRWVAYFLYLPAGRQLDSAHRFTLERLRAADAGLMVICAAPAPGDVPHELHAYADALFWKALPGFDFSAYAIAIRAVAAVSPGADVLFLNDSIFGPFVPVDSLWTTFRWDLSALTGSGQIENHVQSYAFCLRNVTADRLAALADVFPEGAAFDDYAAVVLCQESRLAAVAARSMTVGALWYAEHDVTIDPSLFAAIPLVDAGFPFLKRGLLTKHRRVYPPEIVVDRLLRHGHPTAGFEGAA